MAVWFVGGSLHAVSPWFLRTGYGSTQILRIIASYRFEVVLSRSRAKIARKPSSSYETEEEIFPYGQKEQKNVIGQNPWLAF
jgi:hypothetical protein